MKRWYVLVLIFSLAGCSLLSPFSGSTKSAQTDYSKSYSDESYQAPANVNGRTVILNNHIRKSEVNKTNKTQPLNVWQKFCRWLGNLSIIMVLVIVGGLFAGTSAPLLWFIGRFKVISTALKQVVTGIEKTKAVEANPELKTALSSVMDTKSKMVVDDIRRG